MKNDIYIFLKRSIINQRLAHSYLIVPAENASDSKCLIDKISKLLLGTEDKALLNRALIAERLLISPNEKGVIEKEEIKKLLRFSRLKPVFSQRRLIIIQDTHLLSLPAANNLLKIVEEPPSYLVFFLLTHRPELLPQTILSRCVFLKEGRGPTIFVDESRDLYKEILKADINKRMNLADTLSKKNKDEIIRLLNEWLGVLGETLRDNIKQEVYGKLISQINQIRQTKTILETTYVNPRLSLEKLFLNISNF